jgi:hypothetical protein
MKKAIAISLLILLVLSEACKQESEEPGSELPTITFSQLEFVASIANNTDGFRLTLEFSDGDFDYGLTPQDVSEPYHELNFFISQGNTQKMFASTIEQLRPQFSDSYYLIQPESVETGKLVTLQSMRLQSSLQQFSCAQFTTRLDNVGIKISDKNLVPNPERVVDTITSTLGDILIMQDSFRIERNPYHYNILVTYLVEQSSASFQVFDFQEQFCHQGFNGRIPEILGLNGSTGPFDVKTLSNRKVRVSYNMGSAGFRPLFGGKRVKVRVSVIDRALNESNVVESNPVLVPSN